MAPEHHLTEIPLLRTLYATTAARATRAAVLRNDPVSAELPDITYRIDGVSPDLSELIAYQHLLGETASDVLPAGFVHVVAFPVAVALMTREDFPLPLLGMIHLANRVEQFHSIPIGEQLDITASARNLSAHRQGTQVDLVVEVHTSGELAWRGVSTYLAKGKKLPNLPQAQERERTNFNSEDLPTGLWNLKPEIGRAYGRISGDVNPIHMSALSAKPFGFPRAIAHGMYLAARALAAVGPSRGDAFIWQIDFLKPAFLPSTVAFRLGTPQSNEQGQALVDPISYQGWNLGSGKPHFSGMVAPIT